MRVIGGEFRSRVLKSLPGDDTRPTPDRLRESLFSVLAPRIEGAIFADLCAGTGAVGIEALSRGAAKAIFVERAPKAIALIRENLKSLRLESCADIRCASAAKQVASIAADIYFLDPPYHLDHEYETCMAQLGQRTTPSQVLVQHDRRRTLEESYGNLRRTRELRQGDNVITFYELIS